MTAPGFDERAETPTIEVRVWLHGQLVHSELCETEEQASLVADEWQERDGVICEVDDLSFRHRPEDVLGPEPSEPLTAEYPEQAEAQVGRVSTYQD